MKNIQENRDYCLCVKIMGDPLGVVVTQRFIGSSRLRLVRSFLQIKRLWKGLSQDGQAIAVVF